MTTARNRAIDRLRRDRTLREKTRLLEAPEPVEMEIEEGAMPDERLELLFMCCHPALALEAQVALTLRALGGLTTDEIAAAFLVSGEAMKRRLSRAKSKVKEAGIPFRVPDDSALPERLAAVLAVLYLIFNQGYAGREDLAAEAIRLATVLTKLMPDEPEAHALLALMVLHDARSAARFDGGELILFQEQDRSLWDAERIAHGRASLDRALALKGRGHYTIQAAIASLQLEDPIDWGEVAALYGQLVRLTDSSVAELNRAIAVAELEGAEAGLALVERLDLDGYRYFHSTRGELLARLGRGGEARSAFERALELTPAGPERDFLLRRLAGT